MEELTRLQASQQAFHTHMTRIFNKVEETLASELTYLNTTINQLEKEQIIKLDTQITELLKDATELEEYYGTRRVTRHNIGENEFVEKTCGIISATIPSQEESDRDMKLYCKTQNLRK